MKEDQMKSCFEANGFLTAIDVLDKGELQDARREFAKLEDQFGKDYTQYSLHDSHLRYEWVMNLASHPNILKTVTSLLGPDVILVDSRFICKYPVGQTTYRGSKAPYVAWHQDIKYWTCKGGPVLSVWLALDDVDAENGSVQFIPGSHKLGIMDHRGAGVTGNGLPANLEIPKHLLTVKDMVQCVLKAGQMSVHSAMTVHASGSNMSARRRCGLAMRYIPTTAYPDKAIEPPRSFPGTVLVAGVDRYKHFEDHAPAFFNKTF